MRRHFRHLARLVVAGLAIAAAAAVAATSVVNSRHNLSISGPGAVKSPSETEICIFCHAPHNASPSSGLWNRRTPGTTYVPYTSSTAKGGAGQPTGASLLCLSCHDGTIALGEVLSRGAAIPVTGGPPMPAGTGRLGTDLSDDHPISFAYTAALAASRGELASPATLTGRVRLDATGQLQCTSCHDAHDNSNGKFLVMRNTASALCVTCHQKASWTASSHRTSTATWKGGGTNPWPHTSETTVAGNACENCHRPHTAGGRKWLLNHAAEETNCYACHGGNVAAKNVQGEFTGKSSIHPVAASTGVHTPNEPALASTRHVECVDCHNPHATNGAAGLLPGSLAGVRGINRSGTEANPATREYEICFRCHGDSPGKPAPRTRRQLPDNNIRLQVDGAGPSYHPITAIGRNTNVPSLLGPWTTASTMGCGDCHNNNAGPGAGGTGPKGPHGSTYAPILERQYLTADRTTESPAAYALCYKCHNRNTFVTEGGAFRFHRKHVVEERTPCNVCHAPHGVGSALGTATNNSKLINFDTTVVTPNSSGLLKFESTGTSRGRCYLRCHGDNHNPESY